MPKNVRILIADDDEIIRSVLAAICSSLTAVQVVAEASDGEQLMERFKATSPDVVLLDIEMPKLPGTEALKQIKEFNPNTGVLMLTANSTPSVVKDCVRNGAQRYVLKTNPPDVIRASIREICFKQMKRMAGK